MPYFDFLFYAAALTLGWGISLASYRLFAFRYDWPMGELHATKPMVPVLLGVFAVVIALLFAAARGGDSGGWWILVTGLAWAVFWTGFMRVGSQSSLIFAPAATVVLCAAWISVRPLPALSSDTSAAGRGHAALSPLPGRPSGGNWSNRLASRSQRP
jgi:hypothetical protein